MIKYCESYDIKWFLEGSKLYCIEKETIYEAKNAQGLNLLNPSDMCIGIIGDGCGGGRLFIADTGNRMIKVYDTQTAEVFTILKDINSPIKISKSGCMLSIETYSKEESIKFDLSTMSII